MRRAHYRHTQIVWPVLAPALLFAAIILLGSTRDWPAVATVTVWAIAALVLLLLGTFTVLVDETDVQVRFGTGMVGRRVPLARIRGWRRVRNAWHDIAGTRVIRDGMLYSPGGAHSVELLLDDGRVLRIGTSDPEGLMRALAASRVPEVPDYPLVAAVVRRPLPVRAAAVVMAALLAIAVGHAALLTRDPVVTVTPTAVRIEGWMYSEEFRMSLVTDLRLEESLPPVNVRWNSIALDGAWRGSGRMPGVGSAQFFVRPDRPPFIVLRTRGRSAYVGFRDPARTRALLDQIRAARRN